MSKYLVITIGEHIHYFDNFKAAAAYARDAEVWGLMPRIFKLVYANGELVKDG